MVAPSITMVARMLVLSRLDGHALEEERLVGMFASRFVEMGGGWLQRVVMMVIT